MKTLFRILAFLGPLLQFGMAILSVFVTDFIDLKTKYGLPEELYLEPAGAAFAVWNIIFLSFIVLGIYQLKPSLKDDQRWVSARPFIFVSCMGNIIWFLGDFSTNLTISLFGFLIMLVTLTKLNNIFKLGEKSVSQRERWLVKFPISIFYGWISIAFPLGVTLWLMQTFGLSGYEVLSPEAWSVLVIVVALAIFGYLLWKRKVSVVFISAVVWGLFWIFVANLNDKLSLTIAASAAATLLLIELVVVKLALNKRLVETKSHL
ncbi:MAG: hypothetical protein AAFX87_12160 [Bacteroidota bacterium]